MGFQWATAGWKESKTGRFSNIVDPCRFIIEITGLNYYPNELCMPLDVWRMYSKGKHCSRKRLKQRSCFKLNSFTLSNVRSAVKHWYGNNQRAWQPYLPNQPFYKLTANNAEIVLGESKGISDFQHPFLPPINDAYSINESVVVVVFMNINLPYKSLR